ASACASPLAHPIFQQSDLRPEVQSALRAVCNWPDAAAHTEAHLRAIWEIGMKADAPEAEFIAWRDYILGPSFTEKSGEAVHSMISTMLYNPHLLLKK
ncbi:MAG: hypothetical protein NTX25_18200, partial [Proteobacteria bacterium]|nr:hypothetical protein [Pseudomonadota bacterium]